MVGGIFDIDKYCDLSECCVGSFLFGIDLVESYLVDCFVFGDFIVFWYCFRDGDDDVWYYYVGW